jgi:hypothetical protein
LFAKKFWSVAPWLLALSGLALVTPQAFAGPCNLYAHADLIGPFVSLPPNGSVSDLSVATTMEWVTPTCRGSAEDGCDRTPHFVYNVGLNDRVSSVRVPATCTLFLYEHPGFQGRKAAYRSGDFGAAYAGIPNDAASSARCDCKRADPSALMPHE